MLVYSQSRDRLREDIVRIKIRVMAVVAIAGPPAGIEGKLRQVGEPMSDQVRIDSRRGAAHQSTKRIEICRSRSLGDQVRVEELVMSDLIIGVVMDVVLHFVLDNLQGVGVGFIARPPGTSSSWMPPSSLYWIQKSASIISSAAGNRRVLRLPVKDCPLASAVGCCSTVPRRWFLLPVASGSLGTNGD